MAKYVRVDEDLHQELDILAARKRSTMLAEANVAVRRYLRVENMRLEKLAAKNAANG